VLRRARRRYNNARHASHAAGPYRRQSSRTPLRQERRRRISIPTALTLTRSRKEAWGKGWEPTLKAARSFAPLKDYRARPAHLDLQVGRSGPADSTPPRAAPPEPEGSAQTHHSLGTFGAALARPCAAAQARCGQRPRPAPIASRPRVGELEKGRWENARSSSDSNFLLTVRLKSATAPFHRSSGETPERRQTKPRIPGKQPANATQSWSDPKRLDPSQMAQNSETERAQTTSGILGETAGSETQSRSNLMYTWSVPKSSVIRGWEGGHLRTVAPLTPPQNRPGCRSGLVRPQCVFLPG
jgi:hypothetical protein